MKLKMTSNFSFVKLISYLKTDKGFGKVIDEYITSPLIKDSKENIKENKVMPPTLPSTIKKRKARKSPKSLGSNSTLYDTGKLHDSIKLSNKRGIQTSIILKNAKRIEMEEYGKYHQLGMGRNKKRQFLSLSVKNAETASNEIMKRMVRSWRKKLR
tara:strand:- start:93 stop:560 length:468 start_codon:yes stop_codon:yes gene_type:complete